MPVTSVGIWVLVISSSFISFAIFATFCKKLLNRRSRRSRRRNFVTASFGKHRTTRRLLQERAEEAELVSLIPPQLPLLPPVQPAFLRCGSSVSRRRKRAVA